MGRLLVILAVLLVGCDEEDPATSEHCIMVRMQYIELQYWRTRASVHSLAAIDVSLARLQNENWVCFR